MSRVVVLGEAWGRDEAAAKQPFVGATGRELNRLLEESGLLPAGSARAISPNRYRGDPAFNIELRNRIWADAGLYPTNVLNLQPPGNKVEALCGGKWGSLPPIKAGRYLRPEFAPQLERLERELEREKPNLIIALGATAAWFTLGRAAITKLRGAVAPSKYGKVLPTFHPAYLFHGAWNERVVVRFDLDKARREAEFPEIRRPERFIYIPETLEDIAWCRREILQSNLIAIDIETVGDQITCIGFAWADDHILTIPIFDWSKSDRCYWGHNEEHIVWEIIRELCECPVPKVFQNGLYDIHFLWKRYGICPVNCAHDTMLLHHALQPEVRKSLGFLGSIYSDEPAWKMMRPRGKGTIKREDE